MALHTQVTIPAPRIINDYIKHIQTIERRMIDCRPVFTRLQPAIADMHKKHFNESNLPSKWVLKPSTIKLKKRLGVPNPERPLVRTGRMLEALGNVRPAPQPGEFSVGTNGWPAVIHHNGVAKGRIASKPNYSLPKRQYTIVTDQEVQWVRYTIYRYMLTGMV